MSDCEIIKEYPYKNALRLVFRQLNTKELHNAFLVCKSWWEIGKSVNKERCPSCITITKKEMKVDQNYVLAIKDMIRFLVMKPSFCMFMTNDVTRHNNSENCHCTFLPSSCFSIQIENLVLKNEITFSCVIFPDTTNIQIDNFTFDWEFSSEMYYCPEIYDDMTSDFLRCRKLKCYMDPLMETERASTCCLIVWCKKKKIQDFTNLIKKLAVWYPQSKVATWGGASDNIIVCNKKIDLYKCRKNVDFGLFFINSQHMEVKSLVLDRHCTTKKLIEEKFQVFSESTILKDHSIGFVYTSHIHFYDLVSFLFEKYFPSVKLFHTVGKEPFGGTGLIELFKILQKIVFTENSLHTTIMLLTYN